MDPLSVGRSCYKQKDYEGALRAFTEASFLNFLVHNVVSWLDLFGRVVLRWRSFGKPHTYYSATIESVNHLPGNQNKFRSYHANSP